VSLRIACRTALALCIVVASCVAAPAAVSQAVPVEWKLSSTLGPAYPQGKAAETWARLIGERSRGRLAAKHFPGAALVQRDPGREFAGLREGVVDLAVGSASAWASQASSLYLFSLPWLFPDLASVERALAGDTGAAVFRQLQTSGVVAIAATADAFHELATTRPVHAPPDLAGLRLRASASPLVTDTLIALGALPTAMSASEARSAFARGALDGELLSVASFGASRLYAAGAPRLLLWHAFADALVFAVSPRLWQSLSEADRELLRAAAYDAAREAAALLRRQTDDAALASLARDGAVVIRLTRQGREPFRERTRAVYDKWTAIIGEDLVHAAESAAGR
jgi:TRAP-type C4-dicarboxylate transport system substrate-binding protein